VVRIFVLLTKGREFESRSEQLEQLVEQKKQLWYSLGGYNVGFSLPKHGFESRYRNLEKEIFRRIQLKEQKTNTWRTEY
jgi:hypothetical protein